uniref:Uncharacterized protein n=1 Tax=Meloidogyne enterolobii TaxID=390850 RepID=A0A6V7TLC3_MELEN|nr:unnamed protein product [Meloidogyne enterolobii]
MTENLQNSNNDLSTCLCSCSTSTSENSLNRIKLLEVEKDKTNLAFQLILAKLDLQKQHEEKIMKKEEEIKILKENLEENKNDYCCVWASALKEFSIKASESVSLFGSY